MGAPATHDWQAVRDTAEALGSISEAARQHGVSIDAACQRAKRESWNVGRRPAKALEEAKARHAEAIARANGGSVRTVRTGEAVQATLVEKAEAIGVRAVQIVERSLRPVGELPVASMSDLKAALGIARTAAGLDKTEAPGVSINMALFGAGATSGATIDATGWTDDAQEADLERLEGD